MYKIYHNSRCKKSRAGLQYLKDAGVEHSIVDYINNPVSLDTLKKLFIKLNISPKDMIRKQETIYKSDFKNKEFTDEEWIKIFAQHPKLLKRPIIEDKYKAVLGDPIENLDDFL